MTVTESTPETVDPSTETPDDGTAVPAAEDAVAIVDEVLVEEISIDGMCGVY